MLRAIKGMNDLLPEEAERFHQMEEHFRAALERSGYRELRTPIVEATHLFVRTIGEVTDIVEKEMYSFTHHDDALTLRPEGTAGAARAYIEHNVQGHQPITKWYYVGPMFRAERPQRGRYRQFHQMGAEVFGDPGPGIDAELIDLLATALRGLGISDLEVLVNSIGGTESRAIYKEALVAYLTPHAASLSADSQRRLTTNPLRILDSKNPADRAIVEGAPLATEHLTAEDRAHFDTLLELLSALGTPFVVEPGLVRGLDYYTRTVFEMKGAKEKLGAGNTLLAGGRYDRLVSELEGPNVPAIGFAAGIERLVIATEQERSSARPSDVLVVHMGGTTLASALCVAKELRAGGLRADLDTRAVSLKSQLRRADASGCRYAVVLGASEIERKVAQVKDLKEHQQEDVALSALVGWLKERGGR